MPRPDRPADLLTDRPVASRARRATAGLCAALALLGVCAAEALLDPTGLLALVPRAQVQTEPVHLHGSWSLTGLAVFLPVAAVVTGWTAAVTVGECAGRRRTLLRVWGTTALAVALARGLQLLVEVPTREGARAALWASGLTAEQALLVGWLPGLAALLFARPGTRLTGFGWRWSLTGTALSLALIGPLVGPLLWEGSPTGAFYGERLSLRSLPLGPARFAVELVVAAVVAAVLLVRSSRGFAYARPTRLLLGGWLAAMGGGAAAGAVQTALALPSGWLVAPELAVRVGAGLSLGLAFGWGVLPTLLLLSRALDVMARRRVVTVLTSAVVLALASWSLSVVTPAGAATTPVLTAAAAATAGQPLPALTVRQATDSTSAQIVDADGRQVLLRGVDVDQLVDYAPNASGRPTVQPLTDADFAAMAAMGFDVVRLSVSWSLLEPQRGQWDTGYLKRIQQAVAMAAAHGMYTDIDMHQDAWGRSLAAPAGSACPPGNDPLPAYDGAPQWATVTDGASRCPSSGGPLTRSWRSGRDTAPAVAAAFTSFYHDVDGIQGELVRTWSLLAKTFKDDPAVAGYGLLNEPGFGDDVPVTSSVLLGDYYQRAVREIRAQESDGGFPHLVFIEPSVLWSGLGFDAAPPQGFSDDPYLVFAPHLYNESTTMDRGTGVTLVSIEQGFTLARQQADAYGMPLWIGEWGWFGADDSAKQERFTRAADTQQVGDAVWVWKQACGDPQTGHGAATAGDVVRVDCATGKQLPVAADVAAALDRPYPRCAPGRLTQLRVDGGSLLLAGSGRGTLDVWFPGSARPTVRPVGVSSVGITRASGGWRVTGRTAGSYALTVR
ncbi:glycoside hydrolase family 5 protein [Streptacidiphilus carbonis]|uniref:glycoside hydrolase family 5 protein n=1 Tax=Streptacidiphilus carbonis TaxID=105422 RepID=UPI000693F38E|nr:cellulase family glycosylhydrolase [Streptacidiphilus carbonis]